MEDDDSLRRKVVVKSVKRVFNGFFKIDEAAFNLQRYDGSIAKDVRRLSLERGDSAGAILLDCGAPGSPAAEARIWLVEQFRYSTYEKGPGWILELPTGVIEDGDDPAETVRREVREEAGLEAVKLELIATVYVTPGGSSERIFIYFGRVDGQEPPRMEGLGVRAEGEDIRLVACPAKEFIRRARLGDIDDAKTLIAGLWLGAHWDRVSRP